MKTCRWCNGPLSGLRRGYCSDQCVVKARYQRLRLAEATKAGRSIVLNCVQCGDRLEARCKIVCKKPECKKAQKASVNNKARDEERAKKRSEAKCLSCGGPRTGKYLCEPCNEKRAKEVQATYVLNRQEKQRAKWLERAEEIRLARSEATPLPLGVICPWCKVAESEAKFRENHGNSLCLRCHTTIRQLGPCKQCGGPVGEFGCAQCFVFDPTGKIAGVILLNDKDDRERVVLRPVGSTIFRRKVEIKVDKKGDEEPCVMELPMDQWIKIRS